MFQTIAKVKYWNGVTEEMNERIYFFYSENLIDAAAKMSDYVGDDNIFSISIEFFEEEETYLELDEEIINLLKRKGFLRTLAPEAKVEETVEVRAEHKGSAQEYVFD